MRKTGWPIKGPQMQQTQTHPVLPFVGGTDGVKVHRTPRHCSACVSDIKRSVETISTFNKVGGASGSSGCCGRSVRRCRCSMGRLQEFVQQQGVAHTFHQVTNSWINCCRNKTVTVKSGFPFLRRRRVGLDSLRMARHMSKYSHEKGKEGDSKLVFVKKRSMLSGCLAVVLV